MAILTMISLFISVVAVWVSIRTAKLPYKKALILNTRIPFELNNSYNGISVSSKPLGVDVSACNVGNRAVNIVFLGLAIRDCNLKVKKLQVFTRVLGGCGILKSAEEASVMYYSHELIECLEKEFKWKPVYACAVDIEEKVYLRKRGTVGSLLKVLKSES